MNEERAHPPGTRRYLASHESNSPAVLELHNESHTATGRLRRKRNRGNNPIHRGHGYRYSAPVRPHPPDLRERPATCAAWSRVGDLEALVVPCRRKLLVSVTRALLRGPAVIYLLTIPARIALLHSGRRITLLFRMPVDSVDSILLSMAAVARCPCVASSSALALHFSKSWGRNTSPAASVHVCGGLVLPDGFDFLFLPQLSRPLRMRGLLRGSEDL